MALCLIIADHLRGIIKDVDSEWSWRKEEQPKLAWAAMDLMREAATALETYFVDTNGVTVQRSIITSAMTFLDRWERCLPEYKGPESIFHQFLLRFAKGSVKAWRIWLIDRVY